METIEHKSIDMAKSIALPKIHDHGTCGGEYTTIIWDKNFNVTLLTSIEIFCFTIG